jgi:Polyketide cyclase / dehydrase and lipid transport
MGFFRVSASALIEAPPHVVYSILADYRVGHPSILPRWAFLSLEVEEGGVGAGTVIRFRMRALGVTRESRARVTEPDPGRLLVETDVRTGLRTSFDVRPVTEGSGTLLTILTEWESHGLRGWIEGLLAPRFLRKVYAEELELLARRAAEPAKRGGSAREGG